MKTAARILASAVIEAASKAAPSDVGQILDVALRQARAQGISLRQLRRALRTAMQDASPTLRAMLETATGDAGTQAADIAQALEKQTGRSVQLQQKASPILGGAILTVGDDRLDWSLAGALAQAERALRPRTVTSA